VKHTDIATKLHAEWEDAEADGALVDVGGLDIDRRFLPT
jgi:hypothetical protein